jgi:hypothetical protein
MMTGPKPPVIGTFLFFGHTTCQGSCQVLGNPETPLDLQDYLCWCSNAGACDVAFPEVVTLDELVVQNE